MSHHQLLNHITTFIFDVDGVLTDATVLVTESGEQLRTMSIRDGYALQLAIKQGYRVGVISGGNSAGVVKRLNGLGVNDVFMKVVDKVEVLDQYLSSHSINPKQTLFMGDDIPDIAPMKKVGMPCCPRDAAPEVKAISNYVSAKEGGKGCVRDVIEQVLRVQGKWHSEITTLASK